MTIPPSTPPLPNRTRIPWFVRLFIGVGCLLVLLLALAVPVANWHGKRAWERCRRELAARGESLDWKHYIPSPVPDAQNVFSAPHMTNWFVGHGQQTELRDMLDPNKLAPFLAQQDPSSILAEVTYVTSNEPPHQNNMSLSLRYDAPVLSLWTNSPAAASEHEPIISMTDTPLTQAIDVLARAANLKYQLSPVLASPYYRKHLVTCHWTNIPPEQALFLLLDNSGLGWSDNPKNGALTISLGSDPASRTYMSPQTRAAIRSVLEKAILAGGSDFGSPGLTGPTGLSLVARKPNPIQPAHIVIRTSERAATVQWNRSFSSVTAGATNWTLSTVSNANGFLLVTESPCPAADYLRWSDHFEPEFTATREALKRPYARRDGSYEPAIAAPVPNFVAIRNLARTSAQRAQCDLLLDKPEDALRELTLIHDLRRLSDGDPSDKYITLVSAMINVAVCHIYIGVVADGLRLHAWHDSQLQAIQKQLGELNLCALVANSLRCERAMMESTFETTFNSRIPNGQIAPLPRAAKLLKGWVYQNQVTLARLEQKLIDSYDPTNNVIRIDLANSFKQEEQTLGTHVQTWIASIGVSDFSKALARAASEQTAANQARIVCALERYRIAHGNFPDSLDALTPQLIEKLPHDIMNSQPLKYHRENGDRFQLYSVGWNQIDDDGVTSTNLDQGDWIWPPAK
jgi:hypothetical protein